MHDPAAHWESLTPSELTTETITNVLSGIKDDLWVAAACADAVVDANHDVSVQRQLLETGLQRSKTAVDRAKDASLFPTTPLQGSSTQNSLVAYFRVTPNVAELCHLRRVFLARLDRLATYQDMLDALSEQEDTEPDFTDEEGDDWDDDPWAETDDTPKKSRNVALPFSLAVALTGGLLELAILLASRALLKPLECLVQRHADALWPYRFKILDSIPEHTDPVTFTSILPTIDHPSSSENKWISVSAREETDWVETDAAQEALTEASLSTWIPFPPNTNYTSQSICSDTLDVHQLEKWYRDRVDCIINRAGTIDTALSLVQHGASQGIPGLDSLGEELSLLSRLVYDTFKEDTNAPEVDWTLDRWRALGPSAVVAVYLAHSTPASLQSDIQRLVMPYLFVLESRAEREGTPDPGLPQRLLYEYVLNAPLDRVADVFEASKPTLPQGKRILRNDEDMARLALACLYGNTSLTQWSTMSRIFECLPAWDVDRGDEDEDDAMDTTVASLGQFVQPTTTHATSTPSELLVFFNPLPLVSLSRALDILDVHLESGEILSRWGVPAPLSWFLHSNSNEAEQRAWANKMARRAGGNNRINGQEDWEWLLDDMLRLCGKGENGLKGAFGLLPREEVKKIFFSGLLSTGAFDITKSMLSHSKKLKLTPDVIEDLCLTCSRELYDNASSGNYKFGDMKLAYDCLGVASPSPAIAHEKDFIEATSRLCSFNIMSRPGMPISPIEIRLTKDRLSLVSRVLSSNDDAYRHTEVILDLVHKLGFQGDEVAEVKTLAMIADTALQVEDFDLACENGIRMIKIVERLRVSQPDDAQVQEANLVCWVSSFQLGRQTEFEDTEKKLFFLGKALELCPADRIHDVLSSWRKLEDIYLAQPRSIPSVVQSRSANDPEHTLASLTGASSLRTRLQQFHMPSPPMLNTPDAAALATKTFKSVTSNFGAFRSSSVISGDNDSVQSLPRGEDVQKQASRALSKGIGWLIGADD